jgi:hypothetical protein
MMDMTKFGAVPAYHTSSGLYAGRQDGWNFGVVGRPGIEIPDQADVTSFVQSSNRPSLHQLAPHIAGKWDGKTTICLHDAVKKILGKHRPAQMQPRGTCGGRAAKALLEIIQCVLMAANRRAKYQRISHAFPYGAARKRDNILGPSDGVLDGAMPPTLAYDGAVTFEEAGETSDYGNGSDDLAYKWGMSGPTQAMYDLAKDNKIGKDYAKITNLQEYGDGLMVGGVPIVSDDNGYTMVRDSRGVCKAVREPWYHYHLWSGVIVLPTGQTIVPYDQSWGDNTPSGPLLMDGRWPNYCFGIENYEEVMKNNTVHMVFGFDLFDEEQVIDEIDWHQLGNW